MTSINTSFSLEICQLNTFLIFSSGLFSHVVSTYDALHDILLFMLSISLINLVPYYLTRLTILYYYLNITYIIKTN